MPNNITNLITFGSDDASQAAFQRMLHEMQAEDQPLGSIDFNKLIPRPQELDIEAGSCTDAGLKLYKEFMGESAVLTQATQLAPEAERTAAVRAHLEKWRAVQQKDQKTWDLGEKAYQNIQKYGHPTWYEWCIAHWGTKWNAYGCTALNDKADTMAFLTAWDAPHKLIAALSKKFPDQEIVHRWADEDIGHNVGEMTFKNGDVIDLDIPEGGSRVAYEMAADIMGVELHDFNLYLNKDKTGYEYRDEDDPPPAAPKQKKAKGRGQSR